MLHALYVENLAQIVVRDESCFHSEKANSGFSGSWDEDDWIGQGPAKRRDGKPGRNNDDVMQDLRSDL